MSSQQSESDRHKSTCDCGNDEFLFCKDLNLDKVWKAGNQYCRVCTDCGNRFFLSESMYDAIDDKFVILDGEDEPIPIFDCPACEETVTGTPPQCPYCDVEYDWGPDTDSSESDDQDHRGENTEDTSTDATAES